PVQERIDALGELHSRGIRTFAMIAPVLPGAEGLVKSLAGKVDHVLVDRLNYHYADRLYRERGMAWAMEDPFFFQAVDEIRAGFEAQGISVQVL
ncbi:MAG: radical SAM protein, partial [Acidobacteria bacterium]|nr:radical SAM protein [Acidobacteriota bacterium]